MAETFDLDSLRLGRGMHAKRRLNGVCLTEAVAWFAGLPHSDMPECVSPVLRLYGTYLNDMLLEEPRQLLKAWIPAMVGTAGDGYDGARSYLALDWLACTHVPAWLHRAGLSDEAATMWSLSPIVNYRMAEAAEPVIRAAGESAAAARHDVRWDVSISRRGASGLREFASAAIRADGSNCARNVAGVSSARTEVWETTETVASDAAEAASWIHSAKEIMYTVTKLQMSAIHLLGRMCTVGSEQ